MGKLWRKFAKTVASTRLALWLMLLLTGVAFYGIIKSPLVFYSRWLTVIGILLGVNLLFCTFRQFRSALAWRTRQVRPEQIRLLETLPGAQQVLLPTNCDGREYFMLGGDLLRRRGYRLQEIEEGKNRAWVARRGGIGYWGSPLFHLALLAVLVGAILTSSSESKEWTVLIQGQQAQLELTPYPASEPAALRLDRLNLQFAPNGSFQEVSGDVTLTYRGWTDRGIITRHTKLQAGLLGLVFQDYGWGSQLIFRQGDREIARATVLLQKLPDGKGGYKYETKFTVPQLEPALPVSLKFWPDLVWQGDQPQTAADAPENPALSVAVVDNGQDMKPQVLKLHDSAKFGDLTITFNDFVPWLAVKAVRDWGYPLVAGGVWLAVLGLSLLFLAIPREIILRISENGDAVVIYGRSYRFRQAFSRELAAVCKELAPAKNDSTNVFI